MKYYFWLFQTKFQTFLLSVASMRLLQIYLEVIQHLNSLFLVGRLMNTDDFKVMGGGGGRKGDSE